MIRLVLMGLLVASSHALASQQLAFKVFLDDKEIGYHRVMLSGDSANRKVEVEAKFDVKFFFINAYSYRHKASEQWQGQCLSQISTTTDDGGDQEFVRAEKISDGMSLETPAGTESLSGCVRSFAYWNSDLLDAPKLLNTQTGDYEAVERIDLGMKPLELNGKTLNARKYRLQLDTKFIDLWYSPEGDWLALRSPLEGGRVLSYYREGDLS